MGYNCLFTDIGFTVFRRSDDSISFKGVLDGQLYLVDFKDNQAELDTCLIAKTNIGWLWHRRLAHVGMNNLHKLLKGENILGLTNVHFEKDRICIACQAGKQVGVHHPHKNIMMTNRPLELLHMDLFGPIAYISIGGSKYCLVIVDDYSRFTWVFVGGLPLPKVLENVTNMFFNVTQTDTGGFDFGMKACVIWIYNPGTG
jgi:hypothetical protein